MARINNKQKIWFYEPDMSVIGRLFRLFFIELNKSPEIGYFIAVNGDRIIIEKFDGTVISIPNDNRYFYFIANK